MSKYVPPSKRADFAPRDSAVSVPPRIRTETRTFEHPQCLFLRVDFLPYPRVMQALAEYIRDYREVHPEESAGFYVARPHCKCREACECDVMPMRYATAFFASRALAYHIAGYRPDGSKNTKVEVDEDTTWKSEKPSLLSEMDSGKVLGETTSTGIKFAFNWADAEDEDDMWKEKVKEHVKVIRVFETPLRVRLTSAQDVREVEKVCEIRRSKGKAIYWDGEYLTLRATRARIFDVPEKFHRDVLRTTTVCSKEEVDALHRLLSLVEAKPVNVGRDATGLAYFAYDNTPVEKPEQLSDVRRAELMRAPPGYVLANALFRTSMCAGKTLVLEGVFFRLTVPNCYTYATKAPVAKAPAKAPVAKTPVKEAPKRAPAKPAPKATAKATAKPKGNTFGALSELGQQKGGRRR